VPGALHGGHTRDHRHRRPHQHDQGRIVLAEQPLEHEAHQQKLHHHAHGGQQQAAAQAQAQRRRQPHVHQDQQGGEGQAAITDRQGAGV